MVSGAGQDTAKMAEGPRPIPRDIGLRDSLTGELEQAENRIKILSEELHSAKRIARGCRAALEAMAGDDIEKAPSEF